MGCTTYSGEEDAEVAGHWLRKVERVIDQMQVPEETRVDCVTQLLTESAHSWWETIRGRRAGEDLRWRNLSIHDVGRRLPLFVYLTKRVFFSRLGETKILLESPSSNLRETRNPKLDTGPRDSGTGLVMIKGR